ncbi:MAG: hypothetical protein HQM08_23835 [Candidatus Riflebacteria bacterium]|nr:hypothetical protein [Candidatus Riflebacteria bacterium]
MRRNLSLLSLVFVVVFLFWFEQNFASKHLGKFFTVEKDTPFSDLLDGKITASETIRITGIVSMQGKASKIWLDLKDPVGNEIRVEMADSELKLPEIVGKKAWIEGNRDSSFKVIKFIGNSIEFE